MPDESDYSDVDVRSIYDAALNYGPDEDVMSIDEAEPGHFPFSDDEFAPPYLDDQPIDGADFNGSPIIFLDGVASLKAEQSRILSEAINGLLRLVFLSIMRGSPIGTSILAFVPRGANAIGRVIHKLERKRGHHKALHNITNAICLRYSTRPSVITGHFQTSNSLLGDFPWIMEGSMCHYPCRLRSSRNNPVSRAQPLPH